jgi:hypothetical protein
MGLFSKLKDKFLPPKNELIPESYWIVSINDKTISTVDFEKRENSILISEIEVITILTNDTGPVGIDLWWNLSGNGKNVYIPNGATGEVEMTERLQKLTNFDNEELIRAMRCTNNAEFVVWRKNF